MIVQVTFASEAPYFCGCMQYKPGTPVGLIVGVVVGLTCSLLIVLIVIVLVVAYWQAHRKKKVIQPATNNYYRRRIDNDDASEKSYTFSIPRATLNSEISTLNDEPRNEYSRNIVNDTPLEVFLNNQPMHNGSETNIRDVLGDGTLSSRPSYLTANNGVNIRGFDLVSQQPVPTSWANKPRFSMFRFCGIQKRSSMTRRQRFSQQQMNDALSNSRC